MRGKLKGKVALVTGAASGIGRAAAIAFAREGAKVALSDLDAAAGRKAVRSVRETGGDSIFIKADVSRHAEARAMVRKCVRDLGRLDFAFNNAGIECTGDSPADLAEKDWDRVMGVNLKGVWLCMKYELKEMLKRGSGAIVNNSSVQGLVATRCPAYVASKHGVVGLTKSAALEYASKGIRVNAVCPGSIRTPMLDRYVDGDAAREAEIVADEPIGRIGTPEEVAEAVIWLCSDSSSFVTGHALAVDGGYVAQ